MLSGQYTLGKLILPALPGSNPGKAVFPGLPVSINNIHSRQLSSHRWLMIWITATLTGKYDREGYDHIIENPFFNCYDNPLSTFSIDVDAASYSNVRRILKSGQLPQEGAVRIEEMINYFGYQYTQPAGKDPFAVHTEMAVCPWNINHQLVLIGLQGKK
jgi:hypothetical protein